MQMIASNKNGRSNGLHGVTCHRMRHPAGRGSAMEDDPPHPLPGKDQTRNVNPKRKKLLQEEEITNYVTPPTETRKRTTRRNRIIDDRG